MHQISIFVFSLGIIIHMGVLTTEVAVGDVAGHGTGKALALSVQCANPPFCTKCEA